jgi:hypothetical protein
MYFQQMWRQRSSCRHICGEYSFNVGHRCVLGTIYKTKIVKMFLTSPQQDSINKESSEHHGTIELWCHRVIFFQFLGIAKK